MSICLLQLPLDFLVELFLEHLLLALVSFDPAPHDPVRLRRREAAVGFGAGVPGASPAFFGPMRLHLR